MGGNQSRLWTAYFYCLVRKREKGGEGWGAKGADTLFCSLTQHPRFSFSRTSSHLCMTGTYAPGCCLTPRLQTFPVMPTSTSQHSQECGRSAQWHVSFKEKTKNSGTCAGPSQVQAVVRVSVVAFFAVCHVCLLRRK